MLEREIFGPREWSNISDVLKESSVYFFNCTCAHDGMKRGFPQTKHLTLHFHGVPGQSLLPLPASTISIRSEIKTPLWAAKVHVSSKCTGSRQQTLAKHFVRTILGRYSDASGAWKSMSNEK